MRNLFTKPVRSPSNARQTLRKLVATLLAKTLLDNTEEKPKRMVKHHRDGMSLHDLGGRKYLNTAERRRFLATLDQTVLPVRLFCLILMWSGCRVSEALALTPMNFDLDSGVVEFKTLKRRQHGIVRQVPLPPELLEELSETFKLESARRDLKLARGRLWPWTRSTAWRHVKKIMQAADIHGSSAMPKGLRHTFGVAAFHTVPPHLVQRWLGHASLRTTAIYGDVSGPDERAFAKRIWQDW